MQLISHRALPLRDVFVFGYGSQAILSVQNTRLALGHGLRPAGLYLDVVHPGAHILEAAVSVHHRAAFTTAVARTSAQLNPRGNLQGARIGGRASQI
jgi:hypothetical protein